MLGLSAAHWVVVIGVVVVLFGSARVVHMMGDLGKGLKQLRSSMDEENRG